MGSGLDPESGMRVVSSVTPWGSAAAISATEAAYRAVEELEGQCCVLSLCVDGLH